MWEEDGTDDVQGSVAAVVKHLNDPFALPLGHRPPHTFRYPHKTPRRRPLYPDTHASSCLASTPLSRRWRAIGDRGFAEGQSEWGASDSDAFHMALHHTLPPQGNPIALPPSLLHFVHIAGASVTRAAQVASNWPERHRSCQPITRDGRREGERRGGSRV